MDILSSAVASTASRQFSIEGMTCASLSPVLAAGAMAFSSIFVLTNALRLKGFRQSYGHGETAAPAPGEAQFVPVQ